MNKENILEIDNLERSYSTVMPDGETKVYSVLRGISFQVKRGEFISGDAPSGSPGGSGAAVPRSPGRVGGLLWQRGAVFGKADPGPAAH